jgi:hypothetical protein
MKYYDVTWTETTYYTATIKADNEADARAALLGGDYGEKDCYDHEFNDIESITESDFQNADN